jgi:hypothetical protein
MAISTLPSYKCFFPESPFGDDEGIDTEGALCFALQKAKLKCKIQIEEDESIPWEDARQNKYWFRMGVEKAFSSPPDVLGLAQVHEERQDMKIGHCVVFIGSSKNHLNGTGIVNSKDWHGIVLDSDRDYLYWRKIIDGNEPRIEIERSDGLRQKLYWISSFISVSVVA